MDWIVGYLTGLPAPLVVVLLSMLPILELRRDRMTLEDIFLRLTSDDALSPAPADDGPDTEKPGGSPKAAPSDGPREEDED